MTDEESSVRLRSIYVSDSPTATTPAADAGLGWMDDNTRNRFLYGKSITGDVPRAAAASGVGGVDNDDYKDNDDDDGDDDELENLFESEPEPVSLPESTHSLFFTHRVCSIPWGYAFGITVISVTCLIMALSYNLEDPDAGNPLKVPANVSPSVKIAQYLSILIALLMEEGESYAVYNILVEFVHSLANVCSCPYIQFSVRNPNGTSTASDHSSLII